MIWYHIFLISYALLFFSAFDLTIFFIYLLDYGVLKFVEISCAFHQKMSTEEIMIAPSLRIFYSVLSFLVLSYLISSCSFSKSSKSFLSQVSVLYAQFHNCKQQYWLAMMYEQWNITRKNILTTKWISEDLDLQLYNVLIHYESISKPIPRDRIKKRQVIPKLKKETIYGRQINVF